MSFFSGRSVAAVAALLCLDLERCPRNSPLCRTALRIVASAHAGVQASAVFLYSAGVCAGCGVGEPGHSQVSHRTASGEWRPLGLGRMLSRRWLLPWFLHACLELCPGFASSLPTTGADSTRI